MRNLIIAGGAVLAAAALAPTLAAAQTRCQRVQSENQTAGTVIGGIGGALAGSAIAGRHDRAAGAVIGGVAGAVIGNQVGRSTTDCPPGYYAYDGYDQNGYYDNGQAGYYNNGYSGYGQNGYYNNGYGQNGYYNNGYGRNGYYNNSSGYDTRGYNNGYGYGNGYYNNGYAGNGSSAWQDSYGRTCSWRNQSYQDQYGNWVNRQVQACR